MDFEITFTDVTLLESNGEFNGVSEIMQKPIKIAGKIISNPPSKDWNIKSTITIMHSLGFCAFVCDFKSDGSIIVTSHYPSAKDIYIVDARCLSAWANAYGWKTPEPTQSVIDSWREFWNMQWETHIIDSSYLSKIMGDRDKNNSPVEQDD